jgi:DNA-binding GntR family transcriptional regulator
VGDIPDAIFRLFDVHGRSRIDHATLELVPAKAGRAVARRLALPVGAPYLVLRETHYSAKKQPLALSDVDVNDEYIRFVIVRRSN